MWYLLLTRSATRHNALQHVMFAEQKKAQNLLKRAYKAHRRGQTKLARRLFAIARRAKRKAKQYDLLDLCLTGWNQHTSEPTDMLEELEALRRSLSEMHGEFADFCQQHGL